MLGAREARPMLTETAKTFLESAIKDLQRLSGHAGMIGGDLALLAYLIDMALIEARNQLRDESKPATL
jgi:hypothetical protein